MDCPQQPILGIWVSAHPCGWEPTIWRSRANLCGFLQDWWLASATGMQENLVVTPQRTVWYFSMAEWSGMMYDVIMQGYRGSSAKYDVVMTWERISHYWPFMRGYNYSLICIYYGRLDKPSKKLLSMDEKVFQLIWLTHCTLVVLYGDIDLGQHWNR